MIENVFDKFEFKYNYFEFAVYPCQQIFNSIFFML